MKKFYGSDVFRQDALEWARYEHAWITRRTGDVHHRGIKALEELYRDARQEILRLAQRRLGDAADAEEVAQEAFLRLHRVQQNQVLENPRTFLVRIALNLTVDRLRQRSRQAGTLPKEATEEGQAVDLALINVLTPEDSMAHKQDLKQVLAAIRGLPPRTQHVFLLRTVKHLSNKEIAQKLEISVSAVEKNIKRATASLAAAMDAMDGDAE